MNFETMDLIIIIFAAVISAAVTFYITQNKKTEKFMLSEKETWRKDLRKWALEFTKIELTNTKANISDLNRSKNILRLSINPTRDSKILDKIDSLILIVQMGNGNTDLLVNEIVSEVSLILKRDWEKVKIASSFTGESIYLNIILILGAAFVGAAFVYRFPIFDFYELIILPGIGLVALKLITVELVKDYRFRNYVTRSPIDGKYERSNLFLRPLVWLIRLFGSN